MTSTASQLEFFDPRADFGEDPAYYRHQVITYIGNKRQLLGTIRSAVDDVRSELGKDKLRILDGFAGSGIVSRLFKSFASELVVNDLESYARVIANCYLHNRSLVNQKELEKIIDDMNYIVDSSKTNGNGFIERLYAPENDDFIKEGERAFYTRDNARRIDQFRELIDEQDPKLFDLLLGPLLVAASIHANTAGVFKGFYKDRQTGRGKFGGSGSDALERIMGRIQLQPPILSKFETSVNVYQMNTNELISKVGDFDLVYLDPPYNQHPYGSNYFMLNLLVSNQEPKEISKVSGIPTNWNRSPYNQKKKAFKLLSDLISYVDSHYVLLSFSDEGFISPYQLRTFLNQIGPVREIQIRHNTFRGSRNLHARRTHVVEHLFLVKKKY